MDVLNPYASPEYPCEPTPSITRADLVKNLRLFLENEISSVMLSERLQHFHASKDPIIQYILNCISDVFEEYEGSLKDMTKETWDYFQRLLLILESDCEIEQKRTWHWRWTQIPASIALAYYLSEAIPRLWNDDPWLDLLIPFGLISMVLHKINSIFDFKIEHPFSQLIHPFASWRDLRQAYESIGFQKQKYPRYMTNAKYRESTLMRILNYILMFLFWMLFSPLVLLFQSLPRHEYSELVHFRNK